MSDEEKDYFAVAISLVAAVIGAVLVLLDSAAV